ncbi:MAG: fibronectin type III domain-containing protein, partial [Chloroflexi bacterium]|nr:fibronectin type III domain-containing protein [Chloroflexota bacterium]
MVLAAVLALFAANPAFAQSNTPGKPTDLRAEIAGDNRVRVGWAAPSSNGGSAITGYRVEVSSDSGATWSDAVANTGTQDLTYMHNSAPGTLGLQYRVSAINANGAGAASDVVTVTGGSSLVSNLNQTPATELDFVPDFDHLFVSQTFVSGGEYTITSIEVDSRDSRGDDFDVSLWSISAFRLPDKRTFDFTRPDSFEAGTLEFTAPSNVKVGTGDVYAVVIESRGTNTLTLNSTTSDSEDTGSLSGWKLDNTHGTSMVQGSSVATIWSASSGGESVMIKVRGYAGHAPGAPTGLSPTATGPDRVDLSWIAPSDIGTAAITGYRIEVSTDGSEWTDLVASQTATSYSHMGLSVNSTRHYRVTAVNAIGAGPPSDTVTATTYPTNSPAISSIAVTSSPGEDGAYTTLDVITVGVTFSEAVTVTGEPQLALDVGGAERTAAYAGPGAVTGQLLFTYTVQPMDQDDDGVGVKPNALALNGGAIRASDDSAVINPTYAARTFSGHRVDTEFVLIGNMEQAEGTVLRINAGETYKLSFSYWDSIVIYDLNQIVLDVETASETLTLAVTTRISEVSDGVTYETLTTFSGSVAATGRQPFRSDDFKTTIEGSYRPSNNVEILLTALGSGHIEIGTTASTDDDEAKAYRWSVGNSFSKSTDGTTFTAQTGHLPRFNVVGHTTEVLRVLAAEVVSEPTNGVAYGAGEQIEVFVVTNAPAAATRDELTMPLLLGDDRHEAELVTIGGTFYDVQLDPDAPTPQYVLHFAYAVQPGDTAAGVGIAADPLGDAGVAHAMDNRIARDLSFPAQAPRAGHRVDGTRSEACDAVHCAHIIDRASRLAFKHDQYAVAPGGTATLTVLLDPAYPKTVVIPLSSRVRSTDHSHPATASDYSMPEEITFNAGETEKSFTFQVTNPAAVLHANVLSVSFNEPPFLRRVGDATVRITNTPESVDSSVATNLLAGYDRPDNVHQLPWNVMSNRIFHYDQRYVFVILDVNSDGPGDDAESFVYVQIAPLLSDQALPRLGIATGGRTLRFSEGDPLSFDAPTLTEQGSEHRGEYGWSLTGLRWEVEERYTFEVVEVPVTATFDAVAYPVAEGDEVQVKV